MKKKMLFLCVALFVLTLMSSVSAAPINYNEATDGDLLDISAWLSNPQFFTLDLGTNTISGSETNASDNLNHESDSDLIAFKIPVDMMLSSVTLSVANPQGDALIEYISFETTRYESNRTFTSLNIWLAGNVPFTDKLGTGTDIPLFEGQYAIFKSGWSGLLSPGQYVQWDYALNFVINEKSTIVPIPSTAFLLGLGILGIVGARRRGLKMQRFNSQNFNQGYAA